MMPRSRESRLILLAGCILAVVTWLLDSVVDYTTASNGLTFIQMVFTPPLHAVFARAMLTLTILIVTWAGSRLLGTLDRRSRRIEHLNSVLSSIRDVNQLLVRERHARRLLREACRLLVQERGYIGAWIAHRSVEGEVEGIYSQGLDGAEGAVEAGPAGPELPPCTQQAVEAGTAVLVGADSDLCSCCPLGPACAYSVAIVAEMRYGGEHHGFLGVVLQREMAGDADDPGLVEEIAGDLALGLHGIAVEDELRRNEERFRLLFDRSGDAVFIHEPQGKFVEVNETACRRYGRTREEFLEMSPLDLVVADQRPHVPGRIDTIVRAGGHFFHSVHAAVDGTRMVVEINARIIEYEGEERILSIVRDISMRRQAEQALRMSEALLTEAERLALLGAWQWDIAHDEFQFSEEWGRIHGVESGRLSREELLEIVHADDRSAVEEALEEVLAGTGAYETEYRIIRQTDGAVRWISAHGEAALNEDGVIAVVYGAAQDVTGRRQGQQRLRESREELAVIYANAPVIMMLVDSERRITKVNAYAAELLGRSPDRMVGLRGGDAFRCLNSLDDSRGCGFAEACRDCVVRLMVLDTFETGRSHRQVEASLPFRVRGVRQELTFLLSTTLLHHEAQPTVLVTMEDITELKRAEEELRELNRFREAIIDQTNTAVVVFDPTGRVVVWNRAMADITGYESEEIMGKNAWDRLLDTEAVDAVQSMLDAVMHRGEALTDVETLIRTADGTEKLLSWHARRLADDEGRAIGAVTIGRDVTQHRELERRLERSQRMEAIGRLAGGVAHDFNNMLTAIIGNAKLLEREPLDEQARGRLMDITRAGERSAELTRQLLTFSRQARTEPTVFDLNAVVEEMRSMLDRLTREHTRVEVVLAPEGAPIRADRAQIEQIVMNLVVNARDAMPAGGTIRIETGRMELRAEEASVGKELDPGSYVSLTVSDTGAGMDESTQARAFEPFFTTKEEGTGLGLATVYGVVQDSGGEIELVSGPGEGTVVTVCLPLAEEAPDEDALQGDESGSGANGRVRARVLLAEDEPQLRTLIHSILEPEGYEVLAAESAERALELIGTARGPIDLLVADVVMPGMSGVDLAREMRAKRPELPVLFISGYTNLDLPENARLLEKPFSPNELLEMMGLVLSEADC